MDWRSMSSSAEGALGVAARWALIALVVLAAPAQAKRLYQYVDENGIRHFTDRKPETDQPVEERLMQVDPGSPVSARRQVVGDQTRYYFTNHRDGPIEIEVLVPKKVNITTTPRLPTNFVMLDRGERLLLTIAPADRRRGSSFKMTYRAALGDPQAEPDKNYLYRLPFLPSERYYIGQGFGGSAPASAWAR